MNNMLPSGVTLWSAAGSAIDTMTQTYSSSLDFGLALFPAPATNQCSVGTVQVPIGHRNPMQTVPETIQNGLGPMPPSGGSYTPMASSLAAIGSDAQLNASGRESVVVLITDGWEYCVPHDASTRFNVVNEAERLRRNGIKVYVVGFGASVDALALNRAALAGGTAVPGCDPTSSNAMARNNCYIAALDRVGLTAALSSIGSATTTEECNGEDDDCDGRYDEDFDVDNDTWTTCGTDPATGDTKGPGDCNDNDASINPGASELCDGVDNNCNSVVDEGCSCTNGQVRGCGSDTGQCMFGMQRCMAGTWGECAGNIGPSDVENCNDIDEDCDGVIDEGAECPSGTVCVEGACRENNEMPMDRLDSDMDGLYDDEECPDGRAIDTDGDGNANCFDPDDDGDGIPTIDERPGFMNTDTDMDGMPNHLDPDDDGDTVPTIDERPNGMNQDTDGDSTPNHLDPDDDGDNIPTRQEREEDTTEGDDFDGDGTPSYLDSDADGDGLTDLIETAEDRNGNGLPDYLDVEDLSGYAGGACSTTGGFGGALGLLALCFALFGLVLRRRDDA